MMFTEIGHTVPMLVAVQSH